MAAPKPLEMSQDLTADEKRRIEAAYQAQPSCGCFVLDCLADCLCCNCEDADLEFRKSRQELRSELQHQKQRQGKEEEERAFMEHSSARLRALGGRLDGFDGPRCPRLCCATFLSCGLGAFSTELNRMRCCLIECPIKLLCCETGRQRVCLMDEYDTDDLEVLALMCACAPIFRCFCVKPCRAWAASARRTHHEWRSEAGQRALERHALDWGGADECCYGCGCMCGGCCNDKYKKDAPTLQANASL
jgi:hypothetical protein